MAKSDAQKGSSRSSSALLEKRIEARWQSDMRRRSFKFLMGYIGVQLLYLAGYFLAAYFQKLNYLPLLADSLMLLLHCFIVLLMMMEARHEGKHEGKTSSRLCGGCCRCGSLLLGVAVVIDAVLFALVDEVVETESNKVLHMSGLIEVLGGVPSLDGSSIPHPYKTNSVFQFHCLYLNLFVLPFKQAIIVVPISAALYISIVAAAYISYYENIALSGVSPSTDRDDLVVEISMLTLTLLFTVAAKRMLEQSQRPLFFALEYQKEEVIQEKVKRCTVEFEYSDLKDRFRAIKAGRDSVLDCEGVSLPSGRQAPALLTLCPSLHSAMTAPPAAQGAMATTEAAALSSAPGGSDEKCKGGGGEEASTRACGAEGDCLPPNVYIWVEHQAVPQRLSTVQPGQRVLCYDSLLRGPSYTPVVDVKMTETATMPDWVRVCLTDGTKLEMTANHPVECYRRSIGGEDPGNSFRDCVNAGDLEAGRDSVMVMKTEPVAVSKVQKPGELEGAALPKTTVTLRVQHPDRHTVFLANSPSSRPQGMAVGSADLTRVASLPWRVRRTFLETCHSTSSMSSGSSRHPSSAPAAFGAYGEVIVQAPPGLQLPANNLQAPPFPPSSDNGTFNPDQVSLQPVEEAVDIDEPTMTDNSGRVGFLQHMVRTFHAPPRFWHSSMASVAESSVTGNSSTPEPEPDELDEVSNATREEPRQKLQGGRRRDRQRAKRKANSRPSCGKGEDTKLEVIDGDCPFL